MDFGSIKVKIIHISYRLTAGESLPALSPVSCRISLSLETSPET